MLNFQFTKVGDYGLDTYRHWGDEVFTGCTFEKQYLFLDLPFCVATGGSLSYQIGNWGLYVFLRVAAAEYDYKKSHPPRPAPRLPLVAPVQSSTSASGLLNSGNVGLSQLRVRTCPGSLSRELFLRVLSCDDVLPGYSESFAGSKSRTYLHVDGLVFMHLRPRQSPIAGRLSGRRPENQIPDCSLAASS